MKNEKKQSNQTEKAGPLAALKQLAQDRVWLACLLGIVAALMVLILVVFLIYRSWARAPELPSADSTPAPTESQPPDPDQEPDDDPRDLEGIQPTVSGDRKAGMYTFLLMGRDVESGNTDTLMLVSYNVNTQEAAMMSIPRDTMVNATWDVKKINTVYMVNEASQPGSGVDAVKRYVSMLVGFEPDFTVLVEWEAVGEIVDAIGGVYFDVPFYMHYGDGYQDLYINQPAGYRLLTGTDAMQVVRWRKNNDGVPNPQGTDGSDLVRIRVQQDFIAAMIRQCLQIKNVTKITELAEIFTNRVETELSVGNLCWFAEQALLGGFSTENLYACTMPNRPGDVYSRSYHNMQSYVFPQTGELIDLINGHFNPYEEDVTAANLDIMSLNSDGSVSSSTGTVRDKLAVYPTSHWTTPDEPPETPEDPDPEQPGEGDPDPGTDPNQPEDPAETSDPGQTEPEPPPAEDPQTGPSPEPTSYLPETPADPAETAGPTEES